MYNVLVAGSTKCFKTRFCIEIIVYSSAAYAGCFFLSLLAKIRSPSIGHLRLVSATLISSHFLPLSLISKLCPKNFNFPLPHPLRSLSLQVQYVQSLIYQSLIFQSLIFQSLIFLLFALSWLFAEQSTITLIITLCLLLA